MKTLALILGWFAMVALLLAILTGLFLICLAAARELIDKFKK